MRPALTARERLAADNRLLAVRRSRAWCLTLEECWASLKNWIPAFPLGETATTVARSGMRCMPKVYPRKMYQV